MAALRTASAWSMNGRPFTAIPRTPCCKTASSFPGMTVCVESFMGEVGGSQGVKLEQQVLITSTGRETLSRFPFETRLL